MSTLKAERIRHNLTQQQLSNIIGIPYRTIQSWEEEKRKCPEYVEKLVLEKLNKLDQPDYQTILKNTIDTMENDLKFLKTNEAQAYVTNIISKIKSTLNQ